VPSGRNTYTQGQSVQPLTDHEGSDTMRKLRVLHQSSLLEVPMPRAGDPAVALPDKPQFPCPSKFLPRVSREGGVAVREGPSREGPDADLKVRQLECGTIIKTTNSNLLGKEPATRHVVWGVHGALALLLYTSHVVELVASVVFEERCDRRGDGKTRVLARVFEAVGVLFDFISAATDTQPLYGAPGPWR
jgi:hypothetical protein